MNSTLSSAAAQRAEQDALSRPRLWRSTSLVAGCTFLSRISGFLRDMLTASVFGATLGYDAFLVAFKLPNFFRRLFAEGAFVQAFVPILSEYQVQGTREDTKILLQNTLGSLAVVLLILTVLVECFSDHWVRLMAPGFAGGDRLALTSQLLHITFPYLFLITMAAFGSAVLNTYGMYGPPALTPILLNFGMIIGAVFLAPMFDVPVKALAVGVLIGGMAQIAFQIPFLVWKDLWVWPRVGFRHPGVRRILKRMVPALFGVSVAQVNLLVDTIFASFLPVGSFGWLYYADRLMEFPLGIFGVALATVILPHLSRQVAAGASQAYHRTLHWAMKMIVLIAAPATVSLMLLAKPMVATVFHYGAFHHGDVDQASRALFAFALCLVPVIGAKVFAAAFYAAQDLKTPVYSGVITVLVNMLISGMGIFVFHGQHVALAWALTLSEIVHVVYLGGILWAKGHLPHLNLFFQWTFKMGLALLPMAWIFVQGAHWFEGQLDAALWIRWGALWLILCAGALSYVILGWLLGIRWSHLKEDGA